MKCPNCGEECTQDMVDVGVCEIPSGPLGCENCGWVESLPTFNTRHHEPLIEGVEVGHAVSEVTHRKPGRGGVRHRGTY